MRQEFFREWLVYLRDVVLFISERLVIAWQWLLGWRCLEMTPENIQENLELLRRSVVHLTMRDGKKYTGRLCWKDGAWGWEIRDEDGTLAPSDVKVVVFAKKGGWLW